MNGGQLLLLVVIAVLAALGGAWISQSYLAGGAAEAPDRPAAAALAAGDMVGLRRPDYTLGDSHGEWVSAQDFDGRVVLVNFWATWCQPCREEMPMLAQLHERQQSRGLVVVGIALDDVQQARDFAADLNISYPVLVGATDVMAVTRLYGNASGVLPYSVLIGRDGVIRWTYLGELKEPELVRRVEALLDEATAGS